MNLLAQAGLNVLDHLRAEVGAEQVGKEEARKIHTLIRLAVTIVIGDAVRHHPKHLASHMRKETRLLIVGLLTTDVGEELLTENVLNTHRLLVLDRPRVDVLVHPDDGLLLCANVHRLLETLIKDGALRLIRFRAEDELHDITVGADTKGTEEDEERYLHLDTRNGATQEKNRRILRMLDELDRVGLRHLLVSRPNALDLYDLHLLADVAVVTEHKRAVFRHPLLANDHTFTALNDELATRVLTALAENTGMDVALILKETELASHHHGHLSKMHIGEDTLLRLANSILCVINEGRLDSDINLEGCCIGKIAETSVIGHHRLNAAVVFKDGRFANANILKLKNDLLFVICLRCGRAERIHTVVAHQRICSGG